MELLILLLVFVGTLLLMVGTYTFLNRRRLEAAEATRVRLTGGLGTTTTLSIFKDESVSGLTLLNRLLAGRSFTEALSIELERAGSTQKPGEFVLVTAVCVGIGLLIGSRFGTLFGVVFGAIAAALPWLKLKRKQAARMGKFEAQLPDALDMLVNALKAGYSLQAAMEFVGKEMAEPLGPEFGRFYDEQRLGMDVRTALLKLQERVGTSDVKMFVTSLLIQRETGGNLGEVLGNLATLMRERVAFRGHVKTLTAEPTFSARVLALLPVGIFFALLALNRDYERTLLITPRGRLLLACAACSIVIGYLMMSRMAKIEI